MATRVRKGSVRETEQVRDGFGRVDYADCYAIGMPGGLGIEDKADRLDASVRAAFDGMPRIVDALLKLRHALVKPFGLKTELKVDQTEGAAWNPGERIAPGDKVALFPVLARDDGEIVMGAEDKHLNFRLAFRLEDGSGGRELVSATTFVHYNNWMGPAYFLVVRPFHKLVVRRVMARAAKRLARMVGE